jgi:hypothetical protein
MQATFLSTCDRIKIEGKKEQSMLFAEKLIEEFPGWSDDRIANLSDLSLKEVKAIRLKLTKAPSAKGTAKSKRSKNPEN